MTTRPSARRVALALLLAVMAGSLSAQEPWKDSYYPYFLKGPNDKV